MFWAGRGAIEVVRELKALGVRCGQMGIPGGMELTPAVAADWKSALELGQFAVVTVFAAFNGEDYADAPTVARTVGFIPEATRAEREERMLAVSDFAAALGVGSIATHIGFVPEDESHPDYVAVRDLVRRVCDHAARHNQTFALETGQEPAPVLLRFFEDVARENLGINFDPANMIMYGTGDPIEALDVLQKHVISVHCKDGDWPAKGVEGALGVEYPLGEGKVGMERFLRKLKQIGYTGPLNIEREAEDSFVRLRDIRLGVELLERLRGQI
ncbi:MAG: sugar phosphate isomerase/epimerase [Bryobacterales bacterium]|nr:sugar phosphate isomerase/epimerase [Bryobacterales bacterium]